MKYVKGLDSIRALAVFYVVVSHWGPYLTNNSIVRSFVQIFVQSGPFGVNLFFVLSGFLITSILLNEKVKINNRLDQFVTIKNFFIRRCLRIFPIYYLVIILCGLFSYEFVKDHIGYFLTYTSNLLPYRSNQPNILSHTWSLAVEEQFYLIWPWLIIFINNKYLKFVFISAIITGLVTKYIAVNVYHHAFPVLVFNCLDSFGIGGLYAFIRSHGKKTMRAEKKFMTIFPLMLYMAWKMSSFSGIPICVMYTQVLDSLIAVALIMFCIHNKTEWVRKYLLENPVFNFIGKISYGIYLYHFTFGPAFDDFYRNAMIKYPSAPRIMNNFYVEYGIKLSLLIVICTLSFKLIEQPIISLKKKFEYSPSGKDHIALAVLNSEVK